MKKSDVAKLVQKQWKISKRGLSAYYENAETCYNYYNNGSAEEYRDMMQFTDVEGRKRRAMVNFNGIKENVDSLVGFMAQNRRQAKYSAYPTETGDQEVYSKNMNSLYTFHRENENADQVETDQDTDMFVTGVGATDCDLSYIVGNATTDPNGEILKERIPYDRIYWDPNARNKNLLDANWCGYSKDFELRDALELFQDSKEDDFERVSDEEPTDTGYVYNPWGGLYDKIKRVNNVEWVSQEQDMVRVRYHQWMEYDTFYKAKNPIYEVADPLDATFLKMKLDYVKEQIKIEEVDGIEVRDMFDFDPLAEDLTFDEKTKRLLVEELGDMITFADFKREVYYTAVFSGDHVFKVFKSISQQGFSIKFKTGDYNENGRFWMGVVNPMIEPQKYKNKALTELIFTIACLSKGGVMVEEDAVEDIADFESKWAKTDAVITVATGAITNNKIKEKQSPAFPTGLEGIIQLSDAALHAAGVDPAFLGQLDNDDQSGVLYKRRIKQIIAKFGKYADSITLYQKEDARLHLDLIRVWVENNNGRWVKITGEQGKDQFLQINDDIMAAEYSISIMEAPQSSDEKQQVAAVIGTYGDKIMPVNPQAAMGLYAESINLLPLDGDIKSRLTQMLQPQQQIDPAMVAQLQKQLEQAQAIIQELAAEDKRAETAKKLSDAKLADARAEQTRVNNQLILAKIPQTEAQTIKTLEEAARTNAEANIAERATPENSTVNV